MRFGRLPPLGTRLAKIALVTYAAAPDLTPDDRLLRDALESLGAAAEPVAWDGPHVDWTGYDLVLLRSPWDYFLRPDEFSHWVEDLAARGVNLVNQPAVIRWNSDKRYLLELERHGIPTIPTTLVADEEAGGSLETLLRSRGWDDAVVKPAISGGAHDTWRTSLATARADQAAFEEVRARAASGGVLVQPFVEEVVRDGEWSLLFFDGVYSHAAIKRARGGDFRVQQAHGGVYAAATPPDVCIAQAARVVAAGAACAGVEAGDLAYARVDGVIRDVDGMPTLLLMELECIEPRLFFLQAPAAAGRMASSIMRRLGAGRAAPGGRA